MYKSALTGEREGNTGSSEVSSEPIRSAPAIAPHVSASDSSSASLQITAHRFNGKNFLSWSTSVQIVIRGRGKSGYINGKKPKPTEMDPTFPTWDAENSIVMAWILNSMNDNISQNFIFYPTAQTMWDAVVRRYSDVDNSTQMCDLRDTARTFKQGELSVTDYYSNLTTLWQELDMFNLHSWHCQEDAILYRKIIERERIYDFVSGLNKELDEVRGRMLALRPLPHIDDIFAEVRREESRKKRMLGNPKDLMNPDSAAMVAQNPDNSAMVARNTEMANGGSAANRSNRKQLWCDHCNKPHHTRDTCWKIHGKPTNWRERTTRRDGRIFQANSSELGIGEKKDCSDRSKLHQVSLTSEQLEQFYKLLSPAQPNSLLATRGICLSTESNYNNTCDPWILDSGATDHMTSQSNLFVSYNPSAGNIKIKVADGTFSAVAGTGDIKITPELTLKSVLHVPRLKCNLLSISKITKDLNCLAQFSHDKCMFQDHSGKRIGSAKETGGLYYFENDFEVFKQALTAGCIASSLTNSQKIMLWHRRLGHPNLLYLKHLFPELFSNKELVQFLCEACQLAKHHRATFKPQSYKPSNPFAMIHSDIWGPSRIKNRNGFRWFITFIDDHTRMTWVYLMKEKSETEQIFKNFHTMIKTQFQGEIQIFHTDNGREYFNTVLGPYLANNGIIHQSSCYDTPQQNGIAERKNRHLLEVARSIMFTSNVPKNYWCDALLTATHLINRMPSRVLQYQTPMNRLLHFYPHTRAISSLPLKVFGCISFVHNHSPNKSKLDPRSFKCIFLGYSPTQKGYKCFFPTTQKMFVTMDVTFFESSPFYTKNSLQGEHIQAEDNFWELPSPTLSNFWELPSPTLSNVPNTAPGAPIELPPSNQSPPSPESPQASPGHNRSQPNVNMQGEASQLRELRFYSRKNQTQSTKQPDFTEHGQESEPEPETGKLLINEPIVNDLHKTIAERKGVRSCTQHPISYYVSYDHLSPTVQTFVSKLENTEIPRNVEEALKVPEWKLAVLEEMRALEKNGTWEVVTSPEKKTPVGCKWVFTVKFNSDGTIERYKARLVAKGFTQTYGIDYQETFAPVAKLNTIRILLSIAANLDWKLQQLDVKNAFLNGELEEEVYMDLPPGFDKGKDQGRVCRLKKSLYGLKQSPRAWFDRFSKAVKLQGYKQAQTDHTLFIKHRGSKVTALIVYVDDIILTGDDVEEMEILKKNLAAEFEIKDLGQLRYFLGMEVLRNRTGITVSQRKYILDLLTETGLLGCRPSETPMDTNIKLGSCNDGVPIDKGRYQRLVGKLIYLSHTRPDIAFAVSSVSQFMHSPCEVHLEAVYRILKYLKGTAGKGLYFEKGSKRGVEVFTDADWAGSIDDRRSTSGYCTFIWGNLVTWRSKKQAVVARSSAEAEFRAVAQGMCEALWIKMLLEELKLSYQEPIKLFCDNRAALSICHNPVLHDRTKHVEVDKHFIKEKIESGVICMTYVTTTDQVADVLTKSLARPAFEKMIDKLGMINVYNPA